MADIIDNIDTPEYEQMREELIAIKDDGPWSRDIGLYAWMELVFQRAEVAFGMTLIETPTVRDTWILFNSLNNIKG